MTTIWTALPNGLTGDPSNRRARLSVYVSMRLTGDTPESTLAAFPAALNWPALLQPGQITLQAQSPGATPRAAAIVSAPPEPTLWQALFSGATRVVSHQFDNLTQRPVNTFTASAIHDQLRDGHQRISSSSPVSIPTPAQLRDAYPDLHEALRTSRASPRPPAANATTDELRAFHRSLAQTIFSASHGGDIHTSIERAISSARRLAAASPPGSFVPVIVDDGTPQAQFAQLYAFHHRPPIDPANPPPPIPAPDPAGVLDFHQALSALAHYPEVATGFGSRNRNSRKQPPAIAAWGWIGPAPGRADICEPSRVRQPQPADRIYSGRRSYLHLCAPERRAARDDRRVSQSCPRQPIHPPANRHRRAWSENHQHGGRDCAQGGGGRRRGRRRSRPPHDTKFGAFGQSGRQRDDPCAARRLGPRQ